IDKEGGISSEDCADFSRAMDSILDEADPIENHYIFEVCSPGVERRLRLPEHFENAIGEKVRVKCFKAVDGKKEHIGLLKSYGDSLVIDEDGKETVFDKANVSICKTVFDF
ncbi:MAG: ribosome maturation factor RimP, partial [Oscillospiraceae bacterium]|nr:ribosome maturation factor RimP [Oscillospiraceae bacterium]